MAGVSEQELAALGLEYTVESGWSGRLERSLAPRCCQVHRVSDH